MLSLGTMAESNIEEKQAQVLPSHNREMNGE
jgi:hypothetical protein